MNGIFGSSLNYVGEFRQRIWPLFLCASVVNHDALTQPQRNRDIEFLRFKFTHNK